MWTSSGNKTRFKGSRAGEKTTEEIWTGTSREEYKEGGREINNKLGGEIRNEDETDQHRGKEKS